MISWITQQHSSDIARWLLLAFLIIAPTIAVFTKRGAAGAGVIAAVAAAALLLTRLPDISEFQLLALTVKLERQSQQVEVTLQQLQKLATALAEGSLNELAFSGSIFTGISVGEKFRVRDQIVERLRDIGVPQDDIVKVQRLWIIVYCSILEGQIEARVREAFPTKTDVENEIVQLAKDNGKDGLPSPEALRKWVTTNGLTDPNIIERLDEYQRVWTTGAIHNPDLIPFGSIPTIPGQRTPR
jgi:hypothetical protein